MSAGYDAVVVGARCAGAATAMLLARTGRRVALVDRAPQGADTLSTHAFMRAGVVQLHRWGLLERIVDAGTPAVHRTVFHYGDVEAVVPIKPYGGVDALYAPRRTVLDPILVDAAREAGADVLVASVTDVARDRDGRVDGVVGRDGFRLRSGITVGADGIGSTIARAVGAPVTRRSSSASAFVYAYLPGIDADAYEWFYGLGVTGGLIPTNDGLTCAWVGAPSSRFRDELRADVPSAFRRLLAELSPSLAARVPPADRLRSFPGQPGFLRTPSGPGWALVGDAGYFKDPATAHGMSDALRDAELLVRAIDADAPEDYEATRDRLSRDLFDVTEEIASYRWDTTSIEALLRRLSTAMADEVEHLVALDVPV